jgi:hypothetical protein
VGDQVASCAAAGIAMAIGTQIASRTSRTRRKRGLM